ncbi:MAG: MFS transporter [Bryobacterales bacterium]|nr:MFS transporter [Bryobacterales bacterium]MDE0629429.1 MFS transporter [Bryobacterales bacterium]
MNERDRGTRWYAEVTRQQWTVLLIASLGWVFDTFEGQVYVSSMNEAMPDLLPGMDRMGAAERAGRLAYFNNIAFGAFLVGGAAGGVLFGVLGDRIGRVTTLSITIATYSAFTFLSSLSMTWWHLVAFRFLVAMGVGGEWAVAAALVAEAFPRKARSWSLAIFHASSVIGTWLAIGVGAFIVARGAFILPLAGTPSVASWRVGFATGAVPALLILVIRRKLRGETQAWSRSRKAFKGRTGRAAELFGPALRRRTLVGIALASIGLATFWGVHIYGKDLLRGEIEARLPEPDPSRADGADPEGDRFALLKRWEMLGMLLASTGGGAGLLAFGGLAEALGRRRAFVLFHVVGFGAAVLVFQAISSPVGLMVALPVFGFFTVGMHAGYAVYFPELFPTRVRSTGTGLCFNVARILAAPVLVASGWMQRDLGMTMRSAASLLSLLFLPGAAVIAAGPETKGTDLPE